MNGQVAALWNVASVEPEQSWYRERFRRFLRFFVPYGLGTLLARAVRIHPSLPSASFLLIGLGYAWECAAPQHFSWFTPKAELSDGELKSYRFKALGCVLLLVIAMLAMARLLPDSPLVDPVFYVVAVLGGAYLGAIMEEPGARGPSTRTSSEVGRLLMQRIAVVHRLPGSGRAEPVA